MTCLKCNRTGVKTGENGVLEDDACPGCDGRGFIVCELCGEKEATHYEQLESVCEACRKEEADEDDEAYWDAMDDKGAMQREEAAA